MKFFSSTWISLGSESVAKDIVEKHVQGAQHLPAVNHAQHSQLGGAAYHATVVKNTHISRGLRKMCDEDREMMRSRFNVNYYLTKRERPFAEMSKKQMSKYWKSL